MIRRFVRRCASALLGDDPKRRHWLRNTLAANSVYGVCGIVQWVRAEYVMSMRAVLLLIALLVTSQVFFYGAIRSGWSRRFTDPSLTLAQMVCAILCLSVAYLINPQLRGVLLMVVALVLSFGAFSLGPLRCRQLGWFALAVFTVTFAIGALSRPAVFNPAIELLTFIFTAATLPLMGHLSAQLSQMRRDLRVQRGELREALDRVNRLATRDELTGLPNRRYVRDWIEREMSRARRAQGVLCIALMDLDYFKAVNDKYGHAQGDAVLVNFAGQAQTLLRGTDALARWGGEEFLLACPDTPLDEVLGIIQRIREHLHRPESWQGCESGPVRFSAGVTVHQASEPFEQALSRADAALYEAKRQGRDRSAVA